MKIKLNVVVQNAIYTALYVVLCIVFKPISYGAVQVRIAEALCILPLLDPFAVISVTLGCFIANMLNGNIIDTVFGTIATFIGLFVIRFIKIDKENIKILNVNINIFFIKTLPTILSNAFIIPLVLKYAYSENMPLVFAAIYVAVGEVVAVYIIGFLLYKALKKINIKFER